MARRELEREDILREATALVERVEIQVPGCEEPVVIGFRREGAASVFFGSDPVYQFNTAGQLRRAYAGGLLYKAERGRLVALHRERGPTEAALVRHELDSGETADFLAALESRLSQLKAAVAGNAFVVSGQVPSGADMVGRIRRWLDGLPLQVKVATAPNVH
jgi:hypothetical protein